MERRKYVRIDKADVIRFDKYKAQDLLKEPVPLDLSSITKNISAEGVLFESDEKLIVGDLLKMEISINGWDKFKNEFYKSGRLSVSPPLVVLGTVVRVESLHEDNRFEIGVCFAAIDSGHQFSLIKFINETTE